MRPEDIQKLKALSHELRHRQVVRSRQAADGQRASDRRAAEHRFGPLQRPDSARPSRHRADFASRRRPGR